MKIITIAFIFQFLLSCWPKVDIISRIRQQYGHQTLLIVRKLEKTFLKLTKNDLDIIFLEKCQKLGLIPGFFKLKPANISGLQKKDLYSLENKVLSLELQVRYRTKATIVQEYHNLLQKS